MESERLHIGHFDTTVCFLEFDPASSGHDINEDCVRDSHDDIIGEVVVRQLADRFLGQALERLLDASLIFQLGVDQQIDVFCRT